MKEATIKTYVTYDAEEDKLEVLIKDRTKTFEILLSNKNGISLEDMRLQIGNWIMNEIEEMVDEAKKELHILNGENTEVESNNSWAETRATCPYAENKMVDNGFGGQTLETFCSKDNCEYQDEVYDESNEEYRKVCRV